MMLAILLLAIAPDTAPPLTAQEQLIESQKRPELRLTPSDIETARVDFDKYTNQPVINIAFSPSGNRRFMVLQKGRLGKTIALYIGDRLVAEPILNEYIFDGQVQISGRFTLEEATALQSELTTDKIEP